MYEMIPERKNRIAAYVYGALLLAAFVILFFTVAFPIPFRSVLQTVALAMLMAAILLFSRYSTVGYVYAVTEAHDGGYDLVVDELRRRSRITVCRIGLKEINRAVMVTEENREALKKEAAKKKKYYYCVDMCPADLCYLFVQEGQEEIVIRLSPDERLFRILSEGH